MIRKRRYCTSNHWWIILNVQAIYVFLQTRWSVKTSIFLCHGIKRWYLREWSIMDTFLNAWYFIILRSNRFRFLVESGRSARDAREQEKKSSCFLCAKSLFTWRVRRLFRNICPERQNLSRIFLDLEEGYKPFHSCAIFEAYLTNSLRFSEV